MAGLPEPMDREEALGLLDAEGADLEALLARARRLGQDRRGNRLQLCAIVNAKGGACQERCAFCSQSIHHRTGVPIYPLLAPEAIVASARAAARSGAIRFSIVTSGRSLDDNEVDTIARAIDRIRTTIPGLGTCASLGHIPLKALTILKHSGLGRYHHNLETSRRLHPCITPTRTYEDRLRVISWAQEAGLEVCSGGIIGMGETPEDIVDMAQDLDRSGVNAVPVNFLDPRPGTPFEKRPQLGAMAAIRIVACLRLLLPRQQILICGGRKRVVGAMQAELLQSGVDGLMIGDYLTTTGVSVPEDAAMLERLGMVPETGGRRRKRRHWQDQG